MIFPFSIYVLGDPDGDVEEEKSSDDASLRESDHQKVFGSNRKTL